MIAAEGLELLDVEYLREHEGWILRLFIDKPGSTIGIEECSLVSRAVERALEIHGNRAADLRLREIIWPRELLASEFEALLSTQALHFPMLGGEVNGKLVLDWLLHGDTREVDGARVGDALAEALGREDNPREVRRVLRFCLGCDPPPTPKEG